MPLFKLSALATASVSTEVEAETLQEAIEIARKRHIEQENWGDQLQEKQCWVYEQFDDEPSNIHEEN